MTMALIAAVPDLTAVQWVDEAARSRSADLSAALGARPGYGGVGSVEIGEGTLSFLGTGTLIARDWVLTAAHNWDAGAMTDLTFRWNEETYAAEPGAWFQHPDWLARPEVGLGQGADVGLFRLSEPVWGAEPAEVSARAVDPGDEVLFLGAGLVGSGDTLEANPDATALAGANTIDRVVENADGGALLAADFDDGSSAANTLGTPGVFDEDGVVVNDRLGLDIVGDGSGAIPTFLEAGSAPGDSGAPAFVDYGSGPEIVGLVSWGVNPNRPSSPFGGGPGDITYFTDVTRHRDWIAATIPEPPVGALAFIGLAILAAGCRFRGRNAARS